MNYNTSRLKLAIPEYGRHIHQMVDYCKTITDKEKRNKHAQIIINLMGMLNPHLRDVPDFHHKLWDQLFIMADFDLDVDSPYEKLTRLTAAKKPDKLNYPQQKYSHKYYGNIIRSMIKIASIWEEGDRKNLLIRYLANQMKKSYVKYNKDNVEDGIIIKHLYEISEGKLKLDPNIILVLPSSNKMNNSKLRKNKSNVKKI